MKTFLTILSLGALLALPGQTLAFSIGLNPVDQMIFQGETTQVDIELVLAGNEALYGFDLALSFDPSIIGFGSFATTLLDPVDPFNPLFDFVGGFTFEPAIDPSIVTFNGYFAPWDPFAPPLTGNFTLGSLTFSGLGIGTSPLILSGDLDLGNPGLDFASTSGSISVAPVPEPGTILLLGLGLCAIVACRRRHPQG